ncbi:hypothetical protein RHMOL_Rhmol08G0278300 [Rhododendron molle]|uniref:Uncharacterized protein n=1 Tax=Rhododendron molle TaxID=49168 RepID=A0ACC0MV84_RHOML|nr:hypothetical protein RHMOL_Rhmol08G0278300 [Rhododendron molle]
MPRGTSPPRIVWTASFSLLKMYPNSASEQTGSQFSMTSACCATPTSPSSPVWMSRALGLP